MKQRDASPNYRLWRWRGGVGKWEGRGRYYMVSDGIGALV